MARPSPVPPNFRVVETSAWENAANSCICSSAGMPIPVSVTSKRIVTPSTFSGHRLARRTTSPFGELDRIGGQVGENLAQAERIAEKSLRKVVIDQGGQLQPLGGGAYRHHPGDVLDDVAEIKIDDLELNLPCLDFREVEDIVDQVQQ